MPVLTIIVPGPPMGAPRMTQRDRWTRQVRPCVAAYREWHNRLRKIAVAVPPADAVLRLDWTAYFEPPPSWPKWRQQTAIGQLHRAKPDRDNIDKAVLDGLYDQDAAIAEGQVTKRWGTEARLEIRIEYADAAELVPLASRRSRSGRRKKLAKTLDPRVAKVQAKAAAIARLLKKMKAKPRIVRR